MVFAAFPIHASQPHAFHGPFHKKYFVAFQPERSTNNTDDSKQTESSSAVNKNGCNTPCRRTGTETDSSSSKPEARSCPNANKAGTDTETRRCPGATVLPRCFPKQQQATSQALKSRLHHEETPKVAKVSLDVTGFGAEDISIHVDEETFIVTVSGSRTNKLGDVFRLHRRFSLDRKAAEVDKMSANLEGGILELVVPKKTTTGLRRIPIRVGSSESAGSKDSDSDSDSDSDTPTDTTGAEERVVEPSKGASDNNQEDNDEDKDKATDQPGQNRETDSVEVETVREEDDDEDGDRDRDRDSDSDEEEHEEDSRSGESTENTILRTPSNETKDEESWMEVTK